MRLPRVRFTVRRLMVVVVHVALLCALPHLLLDAFADDGDRRTAVYHEMRASQLLGYAASDPANAAMHLRSHEQHVRDAHRSRDAIGWERWRSLTLLGLIAGWLASRLGPRWLIVALPLGLVATLLILSEAMIRLPIEVIAGLALWAVLVSLPVLGGVILVFALTADNLPKS